MTVQQFYDYCVEHNITDFKIFIDEISVNGCFTGYVELEAERIAIGYGEKMISFF